MAGLTPTAAEADVEVGAFAGYELIARDVELGSFDMSADPAPEPNLIVGGRVAVAFAKRFAIEAEAGLVPTQDDVIGDGATVITARAHGRVDLMTGPLRPFVAVGAGMYVLRSAPQLEDDQDPALHWGGGVRYQLGAFDIRLDARQLMVADRDPGGVTFNFEVTGGVAFRFGGRRPTPPPPPSVTPQPNPNPDPIPVDPVPVDPTPVDPPTVEPTDGDGDGLVDGIDKCPTKPEDTDGFDDDDGCPDVDNDGDSVQDGSDKCPLEAETKNGYQDEDGCPDAVLAELTGIQFVKGSAKIDRASTPLLERALKLLQDNPDLKVEIAGHTSNEGSAQRNLTLSLERAEAVRGWLVKRGIGEDRLYAVGRGADKPVADNSTAQGRDKNRRIEFRILGPDEVF